MLQQQIVATVIGSLLIAIVIVIGVIASSSGDATKRVDTHKNAAPISSGAELAKAIANFATGHSCPPRSQAPDGALGSRAPKIAAERLGGYAIGVVVSCR